MEHVNGWCFRGIYKGGLWEDDLHVSAQQLGPTIMVDCYAASSLSITRQLNANLFILCCLSFSQSEVVYLREPHTTR